MSVASKGWLAACALTLLATVLSARAQTHVNSMVNPAANPAGQVALAARADYWTAERFQAAMPLTLPQAQPGAVMRATPAIAAPAQRPSGRNGRAPTAAWSATAQQLFTPAPRTASAQAVLSAQPQASGTANAPYTSTRVFPLFGGADAPFSADRAYPYRTVGVLFFAIDGLPYRCSASVIQRRVVATAGHCVHSGVTGGYYSDWVFVPAYRDGAAPFGAWRNWQLVTVTDTWSGGGGVVPNAADYAMIVFGDQPMTSGGPAMRLGDVTGWLGYQTFSLAGNHTSKLGYPCNLDNCAKMQNVMSHSVRATEPNNVEYGSDAEGGSSGGPWVQNFETVAVGGRSGRNAGANRVVGVTSYGYVDHSLKLQGASVLDRRWEELMIMACADDGNCN